MVYPLAGQDFRGFGSFEFFGVEVVGILEVCKIVEVLKTILSFSSCLVVRANRIVLAAVAHSSVFQSSLFVG